MMTGDMMAASNPIYLDYNATTPLLPEVVDAVQPYLREHFGNPSSDHAYGRRAREAVECARHQVAALIGCEDDEIIFTGGVTEANNLAILGVADISRARHKIVTTVIEHPAIAEPCLRTQRLGLQLLRAGVDSGGLIDLRDIHNMIDNHVALVTVMHANNETGVLQPVSEISSLAHEVGALMHTDAAQSVGKVPVDVNTLGVDLLSIAAHKLYGPKGAGALYVKRGVKLMPMNVGSGQEQGLRSGTENVASLVGFGVACEVAKRDLESTATFLTDLRDMFWNLLAAGIPNLKLNGHPTLRLPNKLNVRFPKVSGSALLANTPEIAASTGSACHHDGEAASSTILAMGIAPDEALGSVRLSIGRHTTRDTIIHGAELLIRSWRTLAQIE